MASLVGNAGCIASIVGNLRRCSTGMRPLKRLWLIYVKPRAIRAWAEAMSFPAPAQTPQDAVLLL